MYTLSIDNGLLLHENVRPQSSIRTMETIISFEWTTLPQPSYSWKRILGGKYFANNEEIENCSYEVVQRTVNIIFKRQ